MRNAAENVRFLWEKLPIFISIDFEVSSVQVFSHCASPAIQLLFVITLVIILKKYVGT